jgi:hypothetical protein
MTIEQHFSWDFDWESLLRQVHGLRRQDFRFASPVILSCDCKTPAAADVSSPGPVDAPDGRNRPATRIRS